MQPQQFIISLDEHTLKGEFAKPPNKKKKERKTINIFMCENCLQKSDSSTIHKMSCEEKTNQSALSGPIYL